MARHLALIGGLLAVWLVSLDARQPTSALFEFRTSFWNSLHHELHAVARPRPAPAAWTDAIAEGQRAGWARAVEVYRPLGRRSLLFDEGLASMSALLSPLTDDQALDAVPLAPAVTRALQHAAAAYRAHGWPLLQRDARGFIAGVSPLLARHGSAIATKLAAAYDTTWPGAVPVDIVRDAGPPGNIHTTARPGPHVTLAAADPRHQGLAGLELLFHEASHGWDRVLSEALTDEARSQQRVVRPDLWHAVLFFTAGELTRRQLATDGIDYELYAVTQTLSSTAFADVWPAIVAAWTPFLDGTTTRAAATTALVRSVGQLAPGAPQR